MYNYTFSKTTRMWLHIIVLLFERFGSLSPSVTSQKVDLLHPASLKTHGTLPEVYFFGGSGEGSTLLSRCCELNNTSFPLTVLEETSEDDFLFSRWDILEDRLFEC